MNNTTYILKQTVSFFFQPTQSVNGRKTELPYADYEVGDAIDGSENGLKCQLTIYKSDGTIASTVDSISCNALTLFGYNTDISVTDECNSCVISLIKGFAIGTYSYELWYDSSSEADGERIGETGTFVVSAGQNPNAAPPNLP